MESPLFVGRGREDGDADLAERGDGGVGHGAVDGAGALAPCFHDVGQGPRGPPPGRRGRPAWPRRPGRACRPPVRPPGWWWPCCRSCRSRPGRLPSGEGCRGEGQPPHDWPPWVTSQEAAWCGSRECSGWVSVLALASTVPRDGDVGRGELRRRGRADKQHHVGHAGSAQVVARPARRTRPPHVGPSRWPRWIWTP